ncbi:MAG: response regulator transcription factor [Deltaproteobacteria bacterium]|nr:response regulator transcription factor [Deltaproteobacteria bacterium]
MGSKASRALRLLIVEDSGPFRRALAEAVRARFPLVTIFEAEDLAQGRRMVSAAAPEVVFLDINLPDGNGLELADVIRRELPKTAVAVCTSYDLPEYREGAFRHGATHFLCKGDLDWDEVGDIVEAEMGRDKGPRAGVA